MTKLNDFIKLLQMRQEKGRKVSKASYRHIYRRLQKALKEQK